MTNSKSSKSFSFKVAKSAPKKSKALKARDGVAVAGCTDVGHGCFRFRTGFGDGGAYC
jgi:hypothetical protein